VCNGGEILINFKIRGVFRLRWGWQGLPAVIPCGEPEKIMNACTGEGLLPVAVNPIGDTCKPYHS